MARPPFPADPGMAAVHAELHALRQRVQMQHALIDVYAGARAGRAGRLVELWEPLPARVTEAGPAPLALPAAGPEEPEPEPAVPPAVAAWWPVEAPAPEPLLPQPGWALYAALAHVTGTIGFSVCGLGPAEREQAIVLIAAVEREKRNFLPLFLTDSDELEPFRRHGYTVEYLPAEPPAGVGAEAWRAYGAARRAFLIAKWNLSRIVDLGPAGFGGAPADTAAELAATSVEQAAEPAAELAGPEVATAAAPGPSPARPRPQRRKPRPLKPRPRTRRP